MQHDLHALRSWWFEGEATFYRCSRLGTPADHNSPIELKASKQARISVLLSGAESTIKGRGGGSLSALSLDSLSPSPAPSR